MRKLVTLLSVGILAALALPALAARPTASHVVTWTVDEGTVALDTASRQVSVNIQDDVWVECGGANALGTIHMTGTASADDLLIDRQGRIGSFAVETIELTTLISAGGCGDYAGDQMTTSVSGVFETLKGKAVDRWRDDVGRHIVRVGFGVISIGSLVDVPASIEVHTTVSR